MSQQILVTILYCALPIECMQGWHRDDLELNENEAAGDWRHNIRCVRYAPASHREGI